MLAVVLLDRAGRGAAGALLGSMMTFSIGVLAWAIPLVIASGGPSQYRAAFAGQAAEQFTGARYLPEQPDAEANGARNHRGARRAVVRAAARLDCRRHRRRRAGSARLARTARRRTAAGRVRAVPDLSSRRPGVVQPVRAADCSGCRISRGQRSVRCRRERSDIRERGHRRGVARRDTAGGERLFKVSEPGLCGNERPSPASLEGSSQRCRDASAVCSRARDTRRQCEGITVTRHARVDCACRVLARWRPVAGLVPI